MSNVTDDLQSRFGDILDKLQSYVSDTIAREIKYDDEIDAWPLMDKPWYVLTILATYLIFVLKIGPDFMENRRPMDIKPIMLVYNATQTLYNAWLVCWFVFMPGTFDYVWNYSCYSDPGPYGRYLIAQLYKAMWYYFISKVADLSDTQLFGSIFVKAAFWLLDKHVPPNTTVLFFFFYNPVFFVLRKKQSQVTFLHVYHHVNMAFSSWFHLRFIKSEQIALGGVINTLVHTFMYSYYFLAALGPQIKKYLWWKKYLTRLQMFQFVLVIIYAFGLFVFDCNFPKLFMMYVIFDLVVFLHMFVMFYKKTYVEKTKVQ